MEKLSKTEYRQEENFEEYKIHLLIFVALWRHPQSPSHSIAFNMSKETIASSDIMFCLTKKKLFQCQFENKFRRIQNSNSGFGKVPPSASSVFKAWAPTRAFILFIERQLFWTGIPISAISRGGTQEFELRSIKCKKYISGLRSIFLFQKKHNFA